MKKIQRIRPTLSTQEAALELRVSETTVKRLVRRGSLHATKPKKSRGHWASFIIVDKAFREEQHRRLHGLKAPRRKHTPDTDSVQKEFERKAREERLNEICERWCKDDPSPIQTVTPPDDVLEKCRNAMNICLEADAACQEAADACRLHKDSALKCAAHVDEMDNAIRKWRDQEASYHQKCENSAMKCQDIKDSITRYQNEVDTWVMGKVRTIQASELTCTRCTAILAAACILQLILAAYYTLCHFNII